MTDTLAGLTILVPESRELDLFAAMLEAEGATPVRCPLVRIVDLEDTFEADVWIDQLIGDAFDDVVLLTGEGLRRLLVLCRTSERRAAFVSGLGKTRIITRGPKPARALREVGLAAGLAAPIPTSQGVMQALEADDLRGRRIGVQLYPGEGTRLLLATLDQRGAVVTSVTPYRYASQTESDQVANAICWVLAGDIGMVAFTSSPQVDCLFGVAKEHGLDKDLIKRLAITPVAAIGPVVEAALNAYGVTASIRPETSFHLKPLVRAISSAWNRR